MDKYATLVNETINVPRKSIKAIVMLFTNKTKTSSEEYVYPNIDKVKVTIKGVPNSVYSQGIPKTRLFEEAKRVFVDRDLSGKYGELAGQTLTGFFKLNKFALVVDLRTVNDFKFYGNGAKILNTQFGFWSRSPNVRRLLMCYVICLCCLMD